jgi:autotransporter-associated beta strand protein
VSNIWDVNTEGGANSSGLNGIIQAIDVGGGNYGTNVNYTINLTANIDLTQALFGINLGSGSTLTINGNGYTIDGMGDQRGLFVYSGNVILENLAITDAVARGGNGGTYGGGGGAGLGGGLFVAGTSSGNPGHAGASVTLDDVTFSGDKAIGGKGGTYVPGEAGMGGGGGGLGGNGGRVQGTGGGGGGGGIGGAGGAASSPGAGGIVPGVQGGHTGGTGGLGRGSSGGVWGGGGGGGGGGDLHGSPGAGGGGGGGIVGGVPGGGASDGHGGGGGHGGYGGGGGAGGTYAGGGGTGGFGGGGGAAASSSSGIAAGGDGGFGGGGGSGPKPGAGGWGGGNAGNGGGGGGGLGAGGDIFVQQGGSLTIEGGSLGVGTVQGGSGGGGGAGAGSTSGNGIFLQGTPTNFNISPLSGQTLTISGVLAQQNGSFSLVVDGPGTVDLAAANTYQGATTVEEGTLAFASSSYLSSGALTLDAGTTLEVTASTTVTTATAMTVNGNAAISAASGETVNFAGAITGPGTLVIAGGGTIQLSATNNYHGGTTVSGAGTTLLVSNSGETASGSVTVDSGATFDISGSGGTFNSGSGSVTVNSGANFEISAGGGTTFTLARSITGSGNLIVNGGGAFVVATANSSFTGTTTIEGGLDISASGNLGSGPIVFGPGGGGLEIDSSTMPSNEIVDFAPGDSLIDLRGVTDFPPVTPTSPSIFVVGNELEIVDLGKTYVLQLDNSYTGIQFNVSPDGLGGTRISASNLLTDGNFDQVNLASGQPGVTVEPTKGNYTSTAAPGWQGTNTGDQDFTPQATPAFQQAEYINDAGTLSQTFTTSANPGSGYEFVVAVNLGSRLDTGTPSGSATVILSAGGDEIGEATYNAGPVGTSQQLSFYTGNIDPLSLSNQNITLSINNGTNTQLVVGNAIVQAASNLLIDGNFNDVNLASGAPGVTTASRYGNYTSTAPAAWSGNNTGAQAFTAGASSFFGGQTAEFINSGGTLSQSFTAPDVPSGPNLLMVSLDVGTRLDVTDEAPSSGPVTVTAAVNGVTIGQTTYDVTTSTTPGSGTVLQFTTQDLNALGDGGKQVTLTITNGTAAQIIVGDVSVVPALSFDVASGQTITDTTQITGPGIVLTGGGTLVLDNNNTYTGGTIVQSGTLLIDFSTANSAVTVDSGGSIGGGGTAGAVTVESGGTFSPGDPSTFTVASLTLESGSTFGEEIGGTAAGTGGAGGYDQTIVESGGAISLNNATLNVSVVDGFTPSIGDSFTIISNETGDTVSGTFAGLVDGETFEADGARFQINYNVGGNDDVTLTDVACYCRGTLIRTACGNKRVEKLQIGDEVMTASGVTRPIKWIGRRSYSGRFVMGRTDILPVCIKAGALEDNVPRRDLWISPNHAMYFEDEHLDGVLIEARNLVNGASIVQAESVDGVEYIHIELESHDVIIAEGALSETFIDDDSRGIFHNAHEHRVLYPAAAKEVTRYCARRLQDGYELEAVRQRIAQRAGLFSDDNAAGAGELRGYIDLVSAHSIEGWAQNTDHPEAPVCLDIYAGGRLIGQVLANRHRADLEQAGIGSGRHSFTFTTPAGGLASALDALEVRRSLDGALLPMRAKGSEVRAAA